MLLCFRCIPVRIQEDTADASNQVQVLLISSRGGKGWVFPKGGWEQDEVVEAAALRETIEEAGVRGRIEVGSATSYP
jgi:diphosphoinositol-polyphosphate diphosphatase